MKTGDFLVFIRWKNVIMIAMIMLLMKFVLFERFDLNVALDTWHYGLLVLSTILIAVAGYVINDINDVKADQINKPNKLFVGPKISPKAAYNLFIVFNSAGLLIGMYLSFYVGHTTFFIIYVMTSLLLYMYARRIKKQLLIGNVLVSFIVFLSVVLPLVFDIVPVTNPYNNEQQMIALKLVVLFALFAFFLTFLREMVKDIEDIEGDRADGCKSIPIVIGVKKTKGILYVSSLILAVALAYFAYMLIEFDQRASIYLAVFVALPLVGFNFFLWTSKDPKTYHRASAVLKLVMLLGILTMILI